MASDDDPVGSAGPLERTDDEPEIRGPRRPKAAIGALIALLLLVNLSASLYQLPLNRVIERRLCREYYTEHNPTVIGRDGDIPEKLCKVDEVQQGLAWLQGVMDAAWIIGDFVMTIPLGFLAEKYGRRSILWLNLSPRIFMLAWAVIVGYFEASLPLKAIIAAPILSILGGDCVFNSITYALAADITDDPALRATYFGWMSSVTYVVALLGPALAATAMRLLLWLPFWIGIVLLVLAIPTIYLLPSNAALDHELRKRDDAEQRQALLSSPQLKAQDAGPSTWRAVWDRFHTLKAIMASQPRNLTLLLTSFFLTSLASSDTKLLAQYISKRYDWTFAGAGYLLSVKSVVNFTLLTLVIPSLLRSTRTETEHEAGTRNIRYAKTCLRLSVFGALAIALAGNIFFLVPSMLLYALGSALPVFTLSLLKSPLVAPQHSIETRDSSHPENHIFSIVMMVKTLGSLTGAPLMAMLWVHGIRAGGLLLGLPYMISSGCYVAALAVFSGMRLLV